MQSFIKNPDASIRKVVEEHEIPHSSAHNFFKDNIFKPFKSNYYKNYKKTIVIKNRVLLTDDEQVCWRSHFLKL